MKTPWTKGPWNAHEGLLDSNTAERRKNVWGSVLGDGWIISEVLQNADGAHAANATLIAAAPDLAESLAKLLEYHEEEPMQMASHAGPCTPESMCDSICVERVATALHNAAIVAARAALRKAGAL